VRYKYSTELSKSHCESVIRHNVDFFSFTLDGGEFIGWNKMGYFSISISRGCLKSKLIHNKVLGRVIERNEKTYVDFCTYRGFTDVLSMLTIFVISFISINLADINFVINMVWKLVFSALICLFNAAISWIFTNISEDGQENEDLLIEFLKDGLELRELS